MKNTILALTVVLFSVFTVSASALSGESQTNFGTYQVELSDEHVVINNQAFKTYELKYSKTDETYKVLYEPTLEGCKFTVIGENFEIQYECKDNRFGVKLVDSDMRTIKKRDLIKMINYDQFASQQILTTKQKNEEGYLGLVACFMPLLLT